MKILYCLLLVALATAGVNSLFFGEAEETEDVESGDDEDVDDDSDMTTTTTALPVQVSLRPSIQCNVHETSLVTCQNFARFCVHNLNHQVRVELNASYTYMAMAEYFDRDDVAYRGFSKFFRKRAHEDKEQADKVLSYMSSRGGRWRQKPLHAPRTEWDTPARAIQNALELEKQVQDTIYDLHRVASQKNDPHLQNFVEIEMLAPGVDLIKKLSDFSTILRRLGDQSAGVHIFDNQLHQDKR